MGATIDKSDALMALKKSKNPMVLNKPIAIKADKKLFPKLGISLKNNSGEANIAVNRLNDKTKIYSSI